MTAPTEDTPTPQVDEFMKLLGFKLYPSDRIDSSGHTRWYLPHFYDHGALHITKDVGEFFYKAVTTAQLQLVSELEGELPEKQPEIVGESALAAERLAFNRAIDKVAALLEHKKQELERGK